MNKKSRGYNNPFDAIVSGVSNLNKKKERIPGLRDEERLDGKTVLITGSSSGLGYATAVQVAERGANVIMAVRSGIPEKGEEVKRLSGNKNVEMLYVDLADFDSIDAFLKQVKEKEIAIDILICNAAIVPLKSQKTKQGLEQMFMVNYLSKFYLVNKLIALNAIKSQADGFPRIIIVSSESHRNPESFNIDDFGVYKTFGFKETVAKYGYYKMLLTTFANELARRNKTTHIRSLCPGPVNSNIAREAPGWMKPMLKITFSLFFKSPKKACEPVIYFAAESNPKENIDYLFLMSRVAMDEKVTDPKNGERLWKKSEELLEKINQTV